MDNLASLFISYLQTALIFLFVLTILVAVHELGHFWFARLFGMHVDAFAVMMGGIRKTNLSEKLKRPLVPGWMVALPFVGAIVITVLGVVIGATPLYTVGLISLTVALPLWVASRLTAVYHKPPSQGLRILANSWAVGLALTFISTRMQIADLNQILSILFFFSYIGLLILYYQPVLGKAEDAPQGEGSIEIDGEPVPVAFRPLLSRTDKKGTEFSLLLLPLGGFAAIKGMHPKPDGSETKIPQGFYSKSPFARFCVLFAGPLFSILFGVILIAGLFTTVGKAERQNVPVIGQIVPEKPASIAGLKEGDKVLSINGQDTKTFYDIVKIVRENPEGKLLFVVNRDSQELKLTVVPEKDKEPSPVLDEKLEPTTEYKVQGKLGAGPTIKNVVLSLDRALVEALKAPAKAVMSLVGMVSKPGTAGKEAGGLVTIIAITHDLSKDGVAAIVSLAAMLSISLGVMNLLPIPPLDGGQIVVAIIEMFRGGRRLSIQVQNAVSTVGLFLVMALVLSVLALDIGRVVERKKQQEQRKPIERPAPKGTEEIPYKKERS